MLTSNTISDGSRVKATIYDQQFAGTVVGEGRDGTLVIYVRDETDRERAVRPGHPHHSLDLIDESAGRGLEVNL